MDNSKPSPMSDDEFETYVQGLVDEATNHIDHRIRPGREDSWRRYYGGVEAKPVNGGSDIVVRSIQDAAGSIIPELLEVFLASDAVVEFLPNTDNELEGMLCKAANLAVTMAFWNADGWLATHDAVSEAVVSGYGFYKLFIKEKYSQRYSEEYLIGDDVPARMDSGAQLQPMFDPQNEQDPNYHNYTVIEPTVEEELVLEAVPASNIIWDYAPDLNHSWLVGQVTELRVGDLVDMGFTYEELKEVRSHGRDTSRVRTEEMARENYNSSTTGRANQSSTARSWAAMKVSYYELYLKADRDGDGKPECYKVWMAGGDKKILRAQESHPSEMPFVQVPAYRIPHSTYSESLSSRLKEFQEAETRIQRSEIDLAEMISGPMILNATGGGIDANKLGNWKANKIIDCRSVDAVKWLIPPDVGASLLQMAQELKMRREDRSGVSRIGSSLRPEDMADVQATVAEAAGASSEKKIRHLARLQAELAMKPLMGRFLQLLVKLGRLTINWQGQPVVIDSSKFDPTWKMRVKVGLGTGTRNERSSTMMALWSALSEVCKQLGPDNAITDLSKLNNLIHDFGVMQPGLNVTRYLKSAEESKQLMQQKAQEPPPPDPAMEKVKAQAAADQAKLQQKAQYDQQRLQQKMQIDQSNLTYNQQLGMQKLQLDMANKAAIIEQKRQQEQAELEVEYETRMRELAIEADLADQEIKLNTATDIMEIAADAKVKREQAKVKRPLQ